MSFKRIVLLFLTGLIFQGCMLTGKMDKVVSKYYLKKGGLKSPDNKNNFLLVTDSLPKINGFCRSKFENFYTLPILIYTFSKEKIKCNVNTRFYVNTIVNELNTSFEREEVKTRMDDKILEISFNNLPNTFHHHYQSHFIFIQFFIPVSFAYAKEEMYNPTGSIRLNYKIKDKNTLQIIKQGSVEDLIPDARMKKLRSRRKYFVEDFVISYDQSMTEHCKSISQKLINEL